MDGMLSPAGMRRSRCSPCCGFLCVKTARLDRPSFLLARSAAMGVSPKQFEAMQARLGGVRRAGPVLDPVSITLSTHHQVLLGIDPSLRGTGYGVIRLGRPSA